MNIKSFIEVIEYIRMTIVEWLYIKFTKKSPYENKEYNTKY